MGIPSSLGCLLWAVWVECLACPSKPMTPVFNPANSGKTASDIFLGFNYALFKGPLKGLRFGTEVGIPLAQKVTGIQMQNTLVFVSGIQYAFGGH